MGKLKFVLVGVALVVAAAGLWFYWQHQAIYPSTDDAYVQANLVTVAAEVTGRVVEVKAVENQLVKAGDVLFQLDDTILKNAVAEAQAQADTVASAVVSLAGQVTSATAGVTSAATAKQMVDEQLARTQTLLSQGNETQVTLDNAQTASAQAAAALDTAQSQLAAATAAQAANANAGIQARAALATAQANLDHARVTAPVDGWVANLALRPGSAVAAYQPLFSLIENSQWWVDANFKETDLTHIADGMAVQVTIDMLPGVSFPGHVVSSGMGSGSTFALLPTQNASGNWVKVTQRFTVRIALDQTDPGFRVGASAAATVDTTSLPAQP